MTRHTISPAPAPSRGPLSADIGAAPVGSVMHSASGLYTEIPGARPAEAAAETRGADGLDPSTSPERADRRSFGGQRVGAPRMEHRDAAQFRAGSPAGGDLLPAPAGVTDTVEVNVDITDTGYGAPWAQDKIREELRKMAAHTPQADATEAQASWLEAVARDAREGGYQTREPHIIEQTTMSRRCLVSGVILGGVLLGLVVGALVISGLSKAAHDAVYTTTESAAHAQKRPFWMGGAS